MEDRIESLGGHELLRCAHDVLRQLARSEDVRKACEGDLAVAKACAARKQQKRDCEKVENMSNTDTNASSDAASEMPGPSSA